MCAFTSNVIFTFTPRLIFNHFRVAIAVLLLLIPCESLVSLPAADGILMGFELVTGSRLRPRMEDDMFVDELQLLVSGDYCLTSRARFTIQCFDVGIANPVGPLRIHVVDSWGTFGIFW